MTSDTMYWDGLQMRAVTDTPEEGDMLFFVHNGHVVRGRVSRLVKEKGEFKGVVLGGTWKLRPREYGVTSWELRLKRIVMSNPPEVAT